AAENDARDAEVRLIIERGEENPGDCDDEPACGYGASMSSRGCPRGAESHHGRGEEPPGEDIPRCDDVEADLFQHRHDERCEVSHHEAGERDEEHCGSVPRLQWNTGIVNGRGL